MRDFSGHFFHRRNHVEPFLNLPPCSETCLAACTALVHGTRKKLKFVSVFSECFFSKGAMLNPIQTCRFTVKHPGFLDWTGTWYHPKKTRKLMRDFSGHFFHRRYHVEPFLNLPPCSETSNGFWILDSRHMAS